MEILLPAAPLREAYRSADPFPHIALDGLFPSETLEGVLAEFPKPGDVDWRSYDNPTEKKLAMRLGTKIGPRSTNFLQFLNSPPMLRWLEEITGIRGLIPDPYYLGGGMHQIERGGFLKIHADFNWHEQMRLHRRINLLVYLNKDWKEEYGGHLELWDAKAGEGGCRRKILPVFGRAALFNTTDFAYHGHPDPLNCPEGWSRKSLALYYYSATRPSSELTAEHSTLFLKRRGDEWSDTRMARIKELARDLMPPLLLRGLRHLRPGKRRLEDF